jgi:alpha-beta hydrolase superfamily lysophospholipase
MKTDYWRVYYDKQVVEASDQVRRECKIRSTGVDIHIDVYAVPDPNAPVVIFNHGGAGYCRLFVSLALSLNERGYTVLLPDQRGQGLSGGRRGDYTIEECVNNVLDVAQWAKNRYDAPLFLAGGSVGGGITYYAAAAGAPVVAIACLNLFDFGNGFDGLEISRFPALARSAILGKALLAVVRFATPLHRMRIPFNWFGSFDHLMDDRDAEFQAQWDADPNPPRLVSLRSLASHVTTPLPIAFQENQIPVLVINQALDKMVEPSVTRQNYERLGGSKRYLEVPFGHWSSQPRYWEMIVQACDEWFAESL